MSSGDLQIAAVPLSASAVSMMVAMGIEETWAASALRRCGGSDVARAVEFCFSHDMAPLAEADARLDVTKIQVGSDGTSNDVELLTSREE